MLMALSPASASQVTSYLSSWRLDKLIASVRRLPEMGQEDTSRVYREFQEGLGPPFLSLAEREPMRFARRLRSLFMDSGQIKLEAGSNLFAIISPKGNYGYFQFSKLGATWSRLAGPSCDPTLAPNGYRFSEEGQVLEQGEIDPSVVWVLDADGDEQFAGCRYCIKPLADSNVTKRWSGLELGPAQVLVWKLRRLARIEPKETRAPHQRVVDFLAATREAARTSSAPALDFASIVRSSEKGTSELELDDILMATGPDAGPHRVAALIQAGAAQGLVDRFLLMLSRGERQKLLQSLILLESRVAEKVTYWLRLAENLYTEEQLVDLLLAVFQGKGVRLPSEFCQAYVFRSFVRPDSVQIIV
ncbi:MAG: hypothetical protein KC910_21950, partial [Candidatus Eremiobacteraeota bacterium]|nr:hypothetical protein [Candidatus Eremiobacteraeota bacterium]